MYYAKLGMCLFPVPFFPWPFFFYTPYPSGYENFAPLVWIVLRVLRDYESDAHLGG